MSHCLMSPSLFLHNCHHVNDTASCVTLSPVTSVNMSVSLNNVPSCLLSSVSPCQCHYIMFTLSPVASAIASPCQCHCVMCHLAFCHQCQYVSVAKSCAILPTVISVTMSVSLHHVHIVSCCQCHCITMSMSLRHVSPCLLSPVSICQCR